MFHFIMDFCQISLNKQLNQISDKENELFLKNKKKIANQITHILDCESYCVGRRKYLREVSIYHCKQEYVLTFQIYHSERILRTPTVNFQIKKIHGLPIKGYKIDCNYLSENEIFKMLTKKFAKKRTLVAYKGGCIEYDILRNMNVRSINLELLECPKYEILLDKYNLISKCCRYHLSRKYHCSRYEVIVFSLFVKKICGINCDECLIKNKMV